MKETNDHTSVKHLGEVCQFVGGGTPSKSQPQYWNGDIPWLSVKDIKGRIVKKSIDMITYSGLKNSSSNLGKKGELVLVTRINPGESSVLGFNAAINQDLKIVITNLNPMYLHYYFRANKNKIMSLSSGTTVKGISIPKLNSLPISVPSLEEQQRIVDRIERLFAKLDEAEEILENQKRNSDIFRSSVLNYFLYNSNSSVTNYHSQKRKIGDFLYIAGRIGWKGLKADEYTKRGPMLLSVFNLNHGDCVDYSEVNHISNERYEESPEIMVREGDILLTKDGAGIGKVGIVEHLEDKATINSSLLLIRPNDEILPKYLYYSLIGPKMQKIVKERVTGSTTPHLFQRDVKEFKIEVPPLDIQAVIVERLLIAINSINQYSMVSASVTKMINEIKTNILVKEFDFNDIG